MRNDAACLPPWGTSDGLAVEATNAGRVARRAEDSGCRVENRNHLDVFGGWAEMEGRGSNEIWMLLIKEKCSDQVVEVYLTDMFSKCSE